MRPSDRLKRAITGTPFEDTARRVHRFVRTAGGRRLTQAEKAVRYDELMYAALGRILAPDSNCVDIGAFKGEVLEHLVKMAPHGRHHAIEPLPGRARLLRESYPDVVVHQVALLDRCGREVFRHVRSSAASSGFRRRAWDTYDEDDVELIRVDVARLDDLLPEDHPVHFMKIDVEGSEAAMFRGARRTLSTWRPFVAFEMSANSAEVYEELVDRAGLNISLLDDWLRGRAALPRTRFVEEFETGRNFFFLAHTD